MRADGNNLDEVGVGRFLNDYGAGQLRDNYSASGFFGDEDNAGGIFNDNKISHA